MSNSMPHFPVALDVSDPVRPAGFSPDLEATRTRWGVEGEGLHLLHSYQDPWQESTSTSLCPSPCSLSLLLHSPLLRASDTCDYPKGSVPHPWVVTHNCHLSAFLTPCL